MNDFEFEELSDGLDGLLMLVIKVASIIALVKYIRKGKHA